MLAELGWPLTAEQIVERFMGRTDAYMWSEIEANIGRPLPADWHETSTARYREAFERGLTSVDGVEQAIDTIPVPTCVASSGTPEKIAYTLGRTGLLPRFQGRIFSASEVAEGKPAPDLFLHAAKQMGAEPEACVVVEDTRAGVQGARAAGMRVFGYTGGLTPSGWLEREGATEFTDMRELPKLLGF
jgi:HAD superfamily hydrolase (TIGR01509 family)